MVITESTYATADHPERQKVEKEFVDYANSIVSAGACCSPPAFSVGRAQELAMTLFRHGFRYPVGMDGMALKVNEIIMRYQEYIRDPSLFRRTLENTELVVGWSQRRRFIQKPGVIISRPGCSWAALPSSTTRSYPRRTRTASRWSASRCRARRAGRSWTGGSR